MLVRAYAERDAAALAAIYRSAVQEIGPRDYSCEQVAAWLSLAPSAEQVHSLYTDGRTALVAVDARDQPLAFGDLESDGHIGYLYCSPEAAGTGVTPSVYEKLEAEARSRPVSRIYVEASEAARRFFRRRGFRVLARRELHIAGVPIHNFAMEHMLSRS
jgi:putative acetyltransferase